MEAQIAIPVVVLRVLVEQSRVWLREQRDEDERCCQCGCDLLLDEPHDWNCPVPEVQRWIDSV